jgi:hypothetical protein
VVVQDGVPLATLQGFYAGSTTLAHHPGPRLVARLFRASRDTVPESGWTLAQLVDWAARAGGGQAGWATPALGRELRPQPDPRARRVAACEALQRIDPGRAPDSCAELGTR